MDKQQVDDLNDVYFHGSLYTMLLFVLIKNNWEQALYIFDSPSINSNIIEYMNKNNINYWRPSQVKHGNILQNIKKRFGFYQTVFKIKRLQKVTFWGSDNGDISKYFIGDNFMIIEDGLASYLGKDILQVLANNGRFISLGTKYLPYGYSDRIKYVYLTRMLPIPMELSSKAILISIRQLWNQKSINQQSKILKLFGMNLEIVQKYSSFDTILLTQPFDDTGVLTEKEKVVLYKKILVNYPYGKVLIKVHPRERTNYKNIFRDYMIISERFPVEILTLVCSNIKRVITVNSTGAFNLVNMDKIDFYDLKGNVITERRLIDIYKTGMGSINQRFDNGVSMFAKIVLRIERMFC